MQLMPRKAVLAIAAVVDVALNSAERPVAAKALAERHNLPARHLEPVLQALVHHDILEGVRGPHGGYILAREQKRISAADILRAANTVREEDDETDGSDDLIDRAVKPALAQAEQAFLKALERVSVEDMTYRAQSTGKKKHYG
jgi:Rrf2 family protein